MDVTEIEDASRQGSCGGCGGHTHDPEEVSQPQPSSKHERYDPDIASQLRRATPGFRSPPRHAESRPAKRQRLRDEQRREINARIGGLPVNKEEQQRRTKKNKGASKKRDDEARGGALAGQATGYAAEPLPAANHAAGEEPAVKEEQYVPAFDKMTPQERIWNLAPPKPVPKHLRPRKRKNRDPDPEPQLPPPPPGPGHGHGHNGASTTHRM